MTAKCVGTLLATAPTIEGIQRQINRYWATDNYRVDPDTLTITHALGRNVPTGATVEPHRNGYRFVMHRAA